MTKSLVLIKYDYLSKVTAEWLVLNETRIEALTYRSALNLIVIDKPH